MTHNRKIAVIGLGYVGLPVAAAFARSGAPVTGFDIDRGRVEELTAGRDRTLEVDAGDLKQPSLRFTHDPAQLAAADFYIVTVPTPIDGARRPDLGAVMTAIFTGEQVARAIEALDGGAPACVSVFAGRLADFGIDYRPIVRDAIARARKTRNVEIIWASTREVFNVVEADDMGCHVITAPADVLKKLPAIGTKTAAELSLDAVKSFRDDAVSAGLRLEVPASRAAE